MKVFSTVLSFGLVFSSLSFAAPSPANTRAGVTGVVPVKLAGNSLPAFPFFEFVIAFNQGPP